VTFDRHAYIRDDALGGTFGGVGGTDLKGNVIADEESPAIIMLVVES
jgi:hypothetical protein